MSKGIRFVLFLAVIMIGWWLGKQFDFNLADFRTFLQGFPILISGVIFVTLYVLSSTFAWFGPKDFFRITGAVFFGGFVSTLFIWVSEMVNSFIMFSLSRSLGREYIQQKFFVKSGQIDQAGGKTGFWWIFALRTNPLFPFRILDLSYGLTRIDYRKYFHAIWHISFIRILWIQMIVAYIGDTIIREWSTWSALSDKAELIIQMREHVVVPLQSHPYIMKVSIIYFILVLGTTCFAWMREKKGKEA